MDWKRCRREGSSRSERNGLPMSVRFGLPMRAPALLPRFRRRSSIYISLPNSKGRELDWQLHSGWFSFTLVQSILSVSLEKARLSGCVFRGWRIITVKRALQPRALPDSTRCSMPFSTRRPLSAIVLTVLLVLTASSCHKKQVAVPVPSEPAPVPAAEAPQPQPTAPTQPVTTPPATAPAPTTTSPPKEESPYQKNKPADQPPRPKRASRPANPPPAAPATQSPAPTTPPADAPRLGDVLTPDQQH